eukprot:SAG31_NODE_379_length_16485_cov_3.654583_3_plen_177_part_00
MQYIPRPAETLVEVENTATTSTMEVLINATGTKDMAFKGMQYQHATWLAPSTAGGYVESQAGFSQNYNECNSSEACKTYADADGCGNTTIYPESCLERRGREPLGAVRVMGGRNVSFQNCAFSQLGSIYALSANQASQQVSVLGCIFTDISGGAVHIGSTGFPHWQAASHMLTLDF